MKTAFKLFSASLAFGLAIYATICLAQNGDNTQGVIFAYVITECVACYLVGIKNIVCIFNDKEKMSAVSCLALATYIWNIVMVATFDIFNNIKANPYYTFIFVQFIVGNVMMVIGVLLMVGLVIACICPTKKNEISPPIEVVVH